MDTTYCWKSNWSWSSPSNTTWWASSSYESIWKWSWCLII